jgi:hypothetical protein
MLLRSPCKNLKPYDNPFWDFSNGVRVRKRLTKIERFQPKKISGETIFVGFPNFV